MADDEWVDIGAAASFAARPLAQVALSRTCLSISHRDGQFGAISGVRACLPVLLLMLTTQIAPAGAAESAIAATSIPAIAGLAKIQIGYSTQKDIDAQWGEGKTIIGGQPNSGRLWRVKGTPWVIHTDGFEYFKRGLVVDSLEIYEERKPGKGMPYARLMASDLAWLGEVSLGLSIDKVAEVLKRKGLPVIQTGQGCETRAAGFHALENNVQFRTWTVRCDFKNGLLIRLAIEAGHAQSDTTSPVFELRNGERYFRIDGGPAFVLGRNPVGVNPEAFAEHFQNAAAAGERFMRIHFICSPAGEKAGEIHVGMLQAWDAVLDAAERHRLAVLPVLGIWSDWNDGSNGETWHLWEKNPFNATRNGPAKQPGELLEDTPCRQLWFKRLETLVKHWAPRRCIVGWEIFSEVDLITGATEDRAVEFALLAAAVVRAADPAHRSTTVSQAGINAWPKLLSSDGVQIVSVHLYAAHPFGGNLDELILKSVHERLQTYRKPVLIGECGLDWAPPRGTLDVAPGAEVGIRHAIWASAVSGAISGRMLWWQDGWDQFERADVCRYYQQAAVPAVAFVKGMDFTGFAPVACDAPGLMGGMLGNDRRLIGWFRDAQCVPPQWTLKEVSGREVALVGYAGAWKAEFVDTTSGRVIKTSTVQAEKNQLKIPLPAFRGSIALKLTAAKERRSERLEAVVPLDGR
jgi:hypothetical protein